MTPAATTAASAPLPPSGDAAAVAPRERVGGWGRVLALGLAAACLGVLLVAAWLTPADQGHGTHTRLGLPPCGWVVSAGIPCPTCGMTTAFAHAVRLRPVQALHAQPAGFLLAIATSAGFWLSLLVAITGARLHVPIGRWLRPRVLWALAAIWAASWGYKIVTWAG